MYNLLLLEKDTLLAGKLAYSLERNSFDTTTAQTPEDFFALLTGEKCYDLLILDVSFPEIRLPEIGHRLKALEELPPLIFLNGSEEEKTVLEELGCGDDFIQKPFRIPVLCARVRELARRVRMAEQIREQPLPGNSPLLECGDITINLQDHQVYLNQMPLSLTRLEYRLISLLVRNAGHVVTKEQLLHEIWNSAGNPSDSSGLSVYIRRIRKKIEENPARPRHLVTIRNIGYRWNIIG